MSYCSRMTWYLMLPSVTLCGSVNLKSVSIACSNISSPVALSIVYLGIANSSDLKQFCLQAVQNIPIVVTSRCVSKAWLETSSLITTVAGSTTPWTCLSWKATDPARWAVLARKTTDKRQHNSHFGDHSTIPPLGTIKSCSFLICVAVL